MSKPLLELGAVVTADIHRCAPFTDHLVQDILHVAGREGCGHPDGERLPREFIGQRQDFQHLAAVRLIEDEIVGPNVIWRARLLRNVRSCTDFFLLPPGDAQPFGTPQALHTLTVHQLALLFQEGMNKAVAPPGMLLGQCAQPNPKIRVLARLGLVVPA